MQLSTSNAFLRAEVLTNAAGATMPLTLTYLDAEFNGLTNEVQESYTLYRHGETNGFWGSSYSITGPREDIGMPAFSANNAFVVRVPPAFAEGAKLICRLLPDGEEADAVEAEMERQPDGSYVTSLIVPMLDIDGDTSLESVTNAVKLKLAAGTSGWQWARIIISKEVDFSMQELVSKDIPVRRAALFSALVTNEGNGERRATEAVDQAGKTANGRLGYGVTPLFSPDKQALNDMLKRHRVWVHSGHGHHANGITVVKKVGSNYRDMAFKASDITDNDLDYDLVFMNTCESTDMKYVPYLNATEQNCPGWFGPHAYTDGTAVLDIGNKLNAKNYVGWDCEVVRQLSVGIPKMLMQELDSTGTRLEDTRTVRQAVDAVWSKLQNESPRKRDYWWYGIRLNLVNRADSVTIDLNRKPF